MKKSLKVNYIYNLMYQLLIMFLPLIVTPYISRVLGAENIGIYSFTFSILSYFVLFGCLGVNLYGQREIAAVQDNEKKRSKIFIELVLLKFIALLISFILFAIINFGNDVYGIYYKILTIELFSNVFDITWFYQGLEDFKKITIRNTIVKLSLTLLIFILVKSEGDLIKYFLINGISNFIGFLVLWLNLKKWVCKVSIKEIKIFSHLKSTIMLFIPQIAIQIYTVLDKTMLGIMLDDMAEVGYYEQSQKIVRMCLMLVTALGTVMIPRISNLYANKKYDELNEKIEKVFQIVSMIVFPLCFGLIAITKNFVPWFYGEEFLPIISLLSIFSFLLIGIGFNNITGMQYLIPTKKQNTFTVSVVIGAIVNLILNFIFIPIFKSNGAALSTVIAEFIIFFVQILYLRKIFNFKKIFISNFKYGIYSVLMFVVTYLVGINMDASIMTTIIQIIVGGLVYLIILIIMKDKFVFEMLNKVKKILRR